MLYINMLFGFFSAIMADLMFRQGLMAVGWLNVFAAVVNLTAVAAHLIK